MDKNLILNLCIIINLIFLFIFFVSFFVLNSNNSTYFRWGWSDSFIFVSILINTPLKYFTLCIFIFVLNMSEIFLNDLANPIIQFSTYNPYKNNINDFTKLELEIYSNIIYFIQSSKKFVQVIVILSQIDIALISLFSCQISAFIAIKYLLNNKSFEKNRYEVIHEIPKYNSINETSRLVNINI